MQDGSPDGAQFYLIDILKKTRKRLEVSLNAKNPKWSGGSESEHIIFEDGASGGSEGKKVFTLNPQTLVSTELPGALGAENAVEDPAGVFTYISTQKLGDGVSHIGAPISEALEEAKKETFGGEIPQILYIVELNSENGQSRTLAKIPNKDAAENAAISKLSKTSDGAKLYFKMGNALFEVLLRKT